MEAKICDRCGDVPEEDAININVPDRWTKADVEPVRHGHWVHGVCGKDKYIKCSFCRKSIVNNIVTLEGDIAETAFVLCPYCGARLKKEDKI